MMAASASFSDSSSSAARRIFPARSAKEVRRQDRKAPAARASFDSNSALVIGTKERSVWPVAGLMLAMDISPVIDSSGLSSKHEARDELKREVGSLWIAGPRISKKTSLRPQNL